jgi:choline dehydrogenase-like flavoprotein
MNYNLKAKKQNTFDAIIIGSGVTGGYAAKELCDNGINTLMLESVDGR